MPTLRQGLVAVAEQRMALLPRMLQSIEILQLATVDLLAAIDAELAQNEVLDLVRPAEPVPTVPLRDRGRDLRHELLATEPDRPTDLWNHVRCEIGLLDLPADLAACALELASGLDEAGFLPGGSAALHERYGAERAEAARRILMRIEPRGLGATGPIEAMLCQVGDEDPDRPLIEALLREHLAELGRDPHAEVARRLELEVDELELLLERIAGLEPRPAAGFARPPAPGIRPDVVVQTVDGRLEVAVDEHSLPVLEVNARYARLAADRRTPREVRRYLGGKVRSARELIEAVASRKRTLCAVTAAVLAAQPGFLRHGVRAIRPLRMAEIAERLGLHPSTVSRAVAGKYLGHPGGVIALRAFFDGGNRADRAAAPACGRAAILELVREAVAGEDPAAPLSDDAICAWLGTRGVHLARRTVAKHRAELGIPPVAQRRRRRRPGR